MLSTAERDAGRYEARLGTNLLCVYTVTVDTHRCSAPDKSQARLSGGEGAEGWREGMAGDGVC